MLPSFLFPSYKQCRTDTDAVATWLANIAQQCGYPEDLLTSQAASQQKTPKLKCIAPEAAQSKKSDDQSDGSESKSKPESPKHLIAINDFVSLAEWIAKSTKPRVGVPASFVSVLDRAITVRKRHNDRWYSRSKNDGDSSKENQANESHGYFVGILEKVRQVLQPRMPSELLKEPLTQPVGATPTSKGSTTGHGTKLFENLNIEEPSDAFLRSESVASDQKPVSTPQAQYCVNQEPDLEEVYFAVHCLFNDFDNIRRYLQLVWEGYDQGAFDLVAASITTNTAIDFARRLQEDFVETFPKHTDFEKHIKVLYVQLCLASGQDPEFKEYPDDEMNFAVYEDAEKMLFPAYLLVSSFNNILEPGILPVYKPGHYGVYDPSSDRSSKSSREKFREDKIILLEVLPDLCVFAQGPGSIPAEDEVTRGLSEMIKLNKVPIWFAFGAQIFLDIHHTLREQVSCGYYDLVRSAKYVENNIELALKFHEDLRIENWPESNDQGLIQILIRIRDWVKTDAVQNARTELTRSSGFQSPAAKPFLLLKHHPLYCGLLSYSIKALAQDASILFVNAWGSVVYAAHLYNALRQERLLSNVWQDMNLVMCIHGTEDIFVGDFPKTIDDYFKRYLLALGYSATTFARNKRQAKGLITEVSPVFAMFMQRYCGFEGRTNLSPDDVDIILKKHADNDDDETASERSRERRTRMTKIDESGETPSASFSGRNRSSKARSAAAGVRPIQLLNALLEALQSEMPELTVYRFRLHIYSWLLLRAIKEALDDDLRDIYGPGYLERENQLPFVVGYILMTAVGTSKVAGALAPKRKDVVTRRLLAKAAEVMRGMLEAGAAGIELMMLKKDLGAEVNVPDVLEPEVRGNRIDGGAEEIPETII